MFRKAQTPSVSEHAKLRSRQISEFLKLNPTAQPSLNGAGAGDQTATYTLQIQTHTSGLLTLTVILGALFPERPPICQLTVTNSLSHRLHHNYLDGNGYLSLHPKLNQSHWSPHQNLGLLIQDIIREFIQSPPQLVGPNTPAFSAQPPPPPQQQQAPQYPPYQHNQLSAQQPHQQQQQQQSVPLLPSSYMQQQQQQSSASHPSQSPSLSSSSSVPFQSTPPPNYMVPPIPPRRPSNGGISSAAASSSSSVTLTRSRPPEVPTSFPQLDGLSIAQLESYLAGDDSADSIRDLASEQPQLSKLDGVIQQLCDSLEKLAESNLSKRTELENLTSQVNLEATKCREQQQLYHQLLQRQHAAMQKYSLSSIIQQLDSAIESIDQQSESTQSRIEFDKSAPELDQSRIESYIKERILYHERAAKRERLQEIYGKQ